MTSQYRHRRTSNPATAFPNPLEPGEIATNTANRQLAVGDANGASLGVPLALIGVRFFDVRAQYVLNDMVIQGGVLYRANGAISPGAFNASQWTVLADPAIFVAKAGDTMTGGLSLSYAANPTFNLISATPQQRQLIGKTGANNRWNILLGNNTAESGAEVGSDFQIIRYTDAGVTNGAALDINRKTGLATVGGDPTAALGIATKQYVDNYAAPFDALAYNGMQINGSFDVSQENGFPGQIAISNSGRFIADGNWVVASHGVQALTGGLIAAGTPSNIPNALSVGYVTTANPSPGATDDCTVDTRIEGWRVARLGWGTANAQPITLAFWIYNSRVGNYSGCIVNSAANRSYPFTIPYGGAGWEYKTITIPGDTTGTWAKDNTKGMQIYFAMMAGSSEQAPAGAWIAGNFKGATGTINGIAATSDFFQITGVVILPGTQAPSAARSPYIMRPFDQELVTCQRYWGKSGDAMRFSGNVTSAAAYYAAVYFKQSMRTNPTVTLTTGSATNFPATSGAVVGANADGFSETRTANATGVGLFASTWTADARL